jgi:ATP-dependent DNA helicase RecG
MTNTSVRERFGIEPQNIVTASRLIKEAVEAGLVVPYDRYAAPKVMRYYRFGLPRIKALDGYLMRKGY